MYVFQQIDLINVLFRQIFYSRLYLKRATVSSNNNLLDIANSSHQRLIDTIQTPDMKRTLNAYETMETAIAKRTQEIAEFFKAFREANTNKNSTAAIASVVGTPDKQPAVVEKVVISTPAVSAVKAQPEPASVLQNDEKSPSATYRR